MKWHTPCGAWLQPKHMSFEPAWVILEHELAAQIHLTMKQYFQKLKEAEPDNAFRPDTLVRSLLVTDLSNILVRNKCWSSTSMLQFIHKIVFVQVILSSQDLPFFSCTWML